LSKKKKKSSLKFPRQLTAEVSAVVNCRSSAVVNYRRLTSTAVNCQRGISVFYWCVSAKQYVWTTNFIGNCMHWPLLIHTYMKFGGIVTPTIVYDYFKGILRSTNINPNILGQTCMFRIWQLRGVFVGDNLVEVSQNLV